MYWILAIIAVSLIPRSLSAAQDAADIRGLKPLEHFTYSPLLFIIPAAAAVAIAIVLWLILRRRGGTPQPSAPPRPAHEVALALIAQLKRADDFSPEGERRFHFALSEILRAYVEARFGLHATDLTTEEIAARLGEVSELAAPAKEDLVDILKRGDRIKFADDSAGRAGGLALLERVASFVERTRERGPQEAGEVNR